MMKIKTHKNTLIQYREQLQALKTKLYQSVIARTLHSTYHTPHIPIFLYDKDNKAVPNDICYDEGGEYCCHGNVG